MTDEQPVLRPGRLGDPTMSLRDDPRADPRMVAALATVGLDVPPAPSPVPHDGPLEPILAMAAAIEDGLGGTFAGFNEAAGPVAGVVRETIVIPGPDGNDIPLYVHRPEQTSGPLPGIVHLHGGGMVILEAANPTYHLWRDLLAATGLVVVGVEFRNGGGKLGPYPYPAGLNDCVAATRYVLEHAERLGVGKVLLSGESGGGNLSLATALRANREGWIDRIAGVYALCPFIFGNWHTPSAELPSLHENDGYFLDGSMMATLARVYDPDGAHADEPTCWPLRAGAADVAGLPPHVISVNECDPLRDEGLAYLRLLRANDVPAVGRVVAGTCHGAEVLLPTVLPEISGATLRDIKGFAESV
jgi:acetyl esterase/lipase